MSPLSSLSSTSNVWRQWHLHKCLQHPDVDPRSSIDAVKAWGILDNRLGTDAVVAVADDGCDITHPVFKEQKFASWAYIEGGRLWSREHDYAHPVKIKSDIGGLHGSAICSLIAAKPVGDYPMGVAPDCRLLPVRWEQHGGRYNITQSGFAKILDYVEDKIDIMINSWSQCPVFNLRPDIMDRIYRLSTKGGRRNKGILFVWAAGNWNTPINGSTIKPIAYGGGYNKSRTLWNEPRFASKFSNNLTELPNVLLVGAVTSRAERAHYSGYGRGISVVAPSNSAHALNLHEMSGLGLTTADGRIDAVTHNFKGTSGAAAIAAGVAALVCGANPCLDAIEIKSILEQTASKDLSLAPYMVKEIGDYAAFDRGTVDPYLSGEFDNTGWSPWYGYGRVDAYQAVLQAKRSWPHHTSPPIHAGTTPSQD